MLLLATGWFNTNRDLVILTAVLVLANLVLAWTTHRTIRSSNKVAASAERQAIASEEQSAATDKTVTAALAQLNLGRDQLRQEQATLAASVRPLIVEVPLGTQVMNGRHGSAGTGDEGQIWIYQNDGTIRIVVPIRNVGNGTAFVKRSRLRAGVSQLRFDATTDHEVLPTNELATITAVVKPEDRGYEVLIGAVEFRVDVLYSDLAGRQLTQSAIGFTRTPVEMPLAGRCKGSVRQVALYESDDQWALGKQIVSTGAY